MIETWNKWVRKLALGVNQLARPYPDEIVSHLIMHTAALELPKREYVEFAPIKGCCGPIRLSGNCLPVFEYRMFEKKLMEFIQVRVEVSKPDRIEYQCTIDSVTAPERHGEPVDVAERYKEPFEKLTRYLFDYFPFYRNDAMSAALRSRVL